MNHRSLTDQSISSGGVDAVVAQVQAQANATLILSSTGGTLTATDAEQTLVIVSEPLGCWHPLVLWVDLSNMDQNDTTILRVYYRIRDGGDLQLWDSQSFTGVNGGLANGIELTDVTLLPNRHGFQITLQQTAGTNRAYDWELLGEM